MTSPEGRPGLMQGDLVGLDGEPAVIVSRSCDLPRAFPEQVLVAPIVTAQQVEWLRGWDLRRIPIPNDNQQRIADLTRVRSLPKTDLPHEPEHQGCTTEEQARQFGRDVARFTGHPSHPDAVNLTIEPVWKYLRTKRTNATQVPLIEAILDIRATFSPTCDPRDETTLREMTLLFVIATVVGEGLAEDNDDVASLDGLTEQQAAERYRDATDVGDQALALDAYCRALHRRCGLHPPIEHLDVDVISAHKFSYDDYHQSDPLRPDLLSHPEYTAE